MAPTNSLSSISPLPIFSSDEQWLTLATKIILQAGDNADNTAKFLALYSSLPKDFQNDHQDLLVSDATDTYENLVKVLKQRFTVSAYKKFQDLHTLEAIGDRSPTQFLRDLRHKYTAAGVNSDSNLRYAFTCGLPAEYRNIIFSSDDLDQAASRVEELWNANKAILPSFHSNAPPIYHFDSSSTCQEKKHEDTALSKVEKENQRLTQVVSDMSALLQNLNKKIEQLEAQNSSHSSTQKSYHQMFSNPSKSRNSPPMSNSCPPLPSPQNPHNLCRYHITFGAKARNCMPGCGFSNLRIPKHSCNKAFCPWNKFIHQTQEN